LEGRSTKVAVPAEIAGLGVGGSCEISRSVPGSTLTLATGLWLLPSGSPTVELILPLSVMVPPDTPVMRVEIARSGYAPTVTAARVQVMTWPDGVQDQPVPDALR
jgi:hypothetical protein